MFRLLLNSPDALVFPLPAYTLQNTAKEMEAAGNQDISQTVEESEPAPNELAHQSTQQ
jgi:hypothetical protein